MDFVGLLSWALFGLIAGVLAKFLMPGRDPGGCIITILIGIAGAVVGGFIASYLGFGGVEVFEWRGLVIAILGSILLLAIWRVIRPR